MILILIGLSLKEILLQNFKHIVDCDNSSNYIRVHIDVLLMTGYSCGNLCSFIFNMTGTLFMMAE